MKSEYRTSYPSSYTSPRDQPDKKQNSSTIISSNSAIQSISIDLISPSRFQPRKSFDYDSLLRLADSLRRFGMLQPVTVRSFIYNNSPRYELICGERRYRAAILAGFTQIPCYILDTDDLNAAQLSIIENLLRDDLNMFEQAESFDLLISTFKLTQNDVAKRISLSQSAVANKLRLLKFSKEERDLIITNRLTERHARALLRLPDSKTRLRFIALISGDKLNVSSTEVLIDNYLAYLESPKSVSEKQGSRFVRKHPISTGIIKDFRILSNTVEKAADTLRKSGIFVETKSEETDSFYSILISIPKEQHVSRETAAH